MIAVTMTREASEHLRDALSYADAVLADKAESLEGSPRQAYVEEQGDWLRWAMGRISFATTKEESA